MKTSVDVQEAGRIEGDWCGAGSANGMPHLIGKDLFSAPLWIVRQGLWRMTFVAVANVERRWRCRMASEEKLLLFIGTVCLMYGLLNLISALF